MSTSISESNRAARRRSLVGLPTAMSTKAGRHRFEPGDICPNTGLRTGATAAQHAAVNMIRRHGGDLEPRTRRAQ